MKFKVACFDFGKTGTLFLTDPRGFAVVTLDPPDDTFPDALSDDIDADYLLQCAREAPKKNIKALLTNQEAILGIGNTYADEILWEARIAPESKCGAIPADRFADLLGALHRVFEEAIDHIRTVLGDGIQGEIRDHLKVHNPEVEASPTGAPITKKKIASKDTYFTSEQTLYG